VIGSKDPGYTAIRGDEGSEGSGVARTDRSIIPTMLRLAPAGAWFLAAVLLACGSPSAPAPTKVSEQGNLLAPKPAAPAIESPFVNPDRDPPKPRSEPQLPAEELAAVLAKAEQERKIDALVQSSLTLRQCANKIPQSVKCEGELAAILAKAPRHRYEAEYYLSQAIGADEPGLDADYYRRLGEGLQARGRFNDAATAYERMIERSPKPTAADHALLATVLQGVPARLSDASEQLRKAYELDPTRHEWLRDEAILLGQQPDKIAQAIARFEEFKTKTTAADVIADTDRRIAELKQELNAVKEAPSKAPVKPRPKPATR
jgi:tetratricopeptide (TPR) repeat protein